ADFLEDIVADEVEAPVAFTLTVEEPEPVGPFATLIIQGEAFTIIPDNSAQPDNLIRTQTQNPEQTAPTAGFDTFGLREGYTGTGYLDINGNDTGPQAQVTFDAPAGAYEITLRIANGGGIAANGTGTPQPRPMIVEVDGVSASVANTHTGSFGVWQTRTVTIAVPTAGTHTLTILQDNTQGAPNIDAVAIATPGTPVSFAAPVVTGPTEFTVGENQTAVGAIAASDLDGQTLSYALEGADADLFQISPTGVLSFISAPDFETPLSAAESNLYSLDVVVSDGVDSVTQAVTVTVADVDEAPSAPALADPQDVPADAAAGFVVGALSATDPEGEAVAFSVDNPNFAVVGGDLVVAEGATLAAGTVEVIVTAEAGEGPSSQQTFSITIAEAVDQPATAIIVTAVAAPENEAGAL
ncbi:MAG: hypothetical protein CVT86_07425, partial [Alphaproteobacteria bacterium HGW-Alphaproteobacteria-8]